MSVTVTDLLSLPSMREARVLAGQDNLDKVVTSVSVLEYSVVDKTQEYLLNEIDFYGSELVITAFSSVKDDVEAQCMNLRHLSELGVPSVILYYVGILMERVDDQLIQVADEAGIALICMPENLANLRYSEFLSEAMEAILLDRQASVEFKDDVLDQVSRIPVYQRNIDTVLRILSDRIHASVVLVDPSDKPMSSIFWPRTLDIDVNEILNRPESTAPYIYEDATFYVNCQQVITTSDGHLWVYVIKQGSALDAAAVAQVSEILRFFMNLWSTGREENALPDLVRAVLQDEPYKMRRIAEVYNIDVASIHNMWLINLQELEQAASGSTRKDDAIHHLLGIINSELHHSFQTLVANYYDQNIVVLMGETNNRSSLLTLAESLAEAIDRAGYRVRITTCHNLASTTQCRQAWLQNKMALPTALTIWPDLSLLTLQQIAFAYECSQILEKGEGAIATKTALIEGLEQKNKSNLLETLSVYLLDGKSDISQTAKILFVHPNTVKYRLAKIAEYLDDDISCMPLYQQLYTAVALKRLLSS